MRNSGTGETSAGPTSPADEGSGPPGLYHWETTPVWPEGQRGPGGVCVRLSSIAGVGSVER